jgi:hypothetical protein
MDRNSKTLVDPGDGCCKFDVFIREAGGDWPDSIAIQVVTDDDWRDDIVWRTHIVLLTCEAHTRRFLRALKRKSRVFRTFEDQGLTIIGRVSEVGQLLVYTNDGVFASILVDQQEDYLLIQSPAQVPMLTEAIKGYAAVLGWEVM